MIIIIKMAKEPFYDRHSELQFFRQKYLQLSKGELIVVYGRRRLGKTMLIKRFLDEVRGKKVYTFVNDLEDKELMHSFAQDVTTMTGDALKIDSWNVFFEYLYEEAKEEKFVLVIDEFQKLKNLAPGFISELQNYWDSKLKTTKLMLIIVGSSIGMMHKIALSASGALYGRKTGQVQLKPFRYVDFREMFASRSEEEKIMWYSIFGGTPHYLETVYQMEDVHKAILKAVLEKTAPLREETKNVLEFELRTTSRYNAILQSIAQGRQTSKEIADSLQVHSGFLSPYLEKLMNLLGLIEKKEPVLGKEKHTRYVLSDNFFKFWYRFVFPNQTPLELGNVQLVSMKIKNELNSYIGYIFENIVKEAFILHNGQNIKDISLNFTNIGSWWDRAGHEIDLVIENEHELILGEIKWTQEPMTVTILEDLIKKTQFLNYGGRIMYVLVSKNGFTESCERLAAKTKTTLLDLKELEHLFNAATDKHIERQKMVLQ
ncbi:MAG TPA: ATP-binding protein [Candidatus Hodarchaeales archaeon]|nr:ATP-binding protein [Candidatus Hodarchaeales archaeon]